MPVERYYVQNIPPPPGWKVLRNAAPFVTSVAALEGLQAAVPLDSLAAETVPLDVFQAWLASRFCA